MSIVNPFILKCTWSFPVGESHTLLNKILNLQMQVANIQVWVLNIQMWVVNDQKK